MCDKTRTYPLLNSHIKYVYRIPCNMVYVYAADLNGACKYIYILNKTSYMYTLYYFLIEFTTSNNTEHKYTGRILSSLSYPWCKMMLVNVTCSVLLDQKKMACYYTNTPYTPKYIRLFCIYTEYNFSFIHHIRKIVKQPKTHFLWKTVLKMKYSNYYQKSAMK